MREHITLDRKEAEDLADTIEMMIECTITQELVDLFEDHARLIRDKLAGRID